MLKKVCTQNKHTFRNIRKKNPISRHHFHYDIWIEWGATSTSTDILAKCKIECSAESVTGNTANTFLTTNGHFYLILVYSTTFRISPQ